MKCASVMPWDEFPPLEMKERQPLPVKEHGGWQQQGTAKTLLPTQGTEDRT